MNMKLVWAVAALSLTLASVAEARERQRGHGGVNGISGVSGVSGFNGPGGHARPGTRADHGLRGDFRSRHPGAGWVNRSLRPGWSGAAFYGHRQGGWHGGWHGSYGSRWRWAGPSIGIVLPIVPGFYSPLWWDGTVYDRDDAFQEIPEPGHRYRAVPPRNSADVPISAPPAPDPVIYPRNGQSAEQTEADRQQCNTWATTQPQAVADAAVFQRSVAACMDARGYTVR